MARPFIPEAEWTIDRRWAGVLLLVSTLLGLSLMVVPVHWIIIAIVGLVVTTYLALNPEKIFYLAIFTIPFTERVRILPISFSVNDLLILFCATAAFGHWFLRDQRVSLRTGLDGWIAVLTGIFFLAGAFSEADSGLLGFFKIFEGFVMYYMAVYFIRTRQVTRAQVIKVLLLTAVFQASLDVFQSVTGIGADFDSYRGYLGYLGLGSSHVWHGRGTTWHFNALGNFLVTSLLFLAPFFIFVVRRKRWALMLGGLITLGVITTYSRGSLLGLCVGLVFLLAVIQPTLKRAMLFAGAFVGLIVLPGALILANTSYVQTLSLSDRLMIWQVPISAITSSGKAFWLGSGLNSYADVAWPYIPAWVPPDQFHNWFAHNFYLLTVLEIGVLGALVFFGFLVYLWLDTWRNFKRWHGFYSIYSLSISAALTTVFFISIFDHTFASPYFKVFLFLLLGLLYVKRNPTSKRLERRY